MKSQLDIHPYTEWFVENLQYKDNLLVITVEESPKMAGNINSPKRYLIIFNDALTFQKYEEADHFENYSENRTVGVIGKYSHSILIEFYKTKTMLFELIPGKIEHYSLITSNECFHVLTRLEPQIVNVT
ncbi:hypothetical protein [Arsukibacterium sp.]|uniref:hypothetical protein n=1 Tax=Arsukibacterium sp. TaxID=1977258 RepID=UPI001BD1DA14|nr:hypothetical protein [Arsukibacterium sp.]